jgi:hypothetical protein
MRKSEQIWEAMMKSIWESKKFRREQQ